MPSQERKIAAPPVTKETEPFWEGAKAGRLMLKHCTACNQFHHYPRSICPFCGSDQTEWRQASGRGAIYSFSVMRRVPIPYAIAYVTLEEGVTMITNLVDCDFDALRIGQKVAVAFKPTDGGAPVPMFAPTR